MTHTQGEHAQTEAMYAAAMEFAAEKASISYVQRKCRCSYNDAERMLERMVDEGIIETYGGRKTVATTTAQPAAPRWSDFAGDLSKQGPLVITLENVNDGKQWHATSNHSQRIVVGQFDAHEALRIALENAGNKAEQPGTAYAALPRAGAIGYASVVDIDSYAKTLTIGPHLPGVRDVALWTTDQMRDFADRTHALRASNGQAPAGAKSARHYGPLRDADAEYGKPLSVYATTAQAAPAAGAVVGPWKDHQTREIVNQLRDCAKEFHATQQLRERLLYVLGPMIDWMRAVQAPTPAAQADSVLEDAALLRYACTEGGANGLKWLSVYELWNGEGYFIDALRAAYKQDAARKQGGV